MSYFFRCLLIFSSILFFFSCEDDEICIEPLSPSLKTEILPLNNLSVFSIDSIAVKDITSIPNKIILASKQLDANAFQLVLPANKTTNQYQIYLEFASTDILQTKAPITETLTINYSSKNSYVSKACGFKSSFFNLSFSNTGLLLINNPKTEISIPNETHLILQF